MDNHGSLLHLPQQYLARLTSEFKAQSTAVQALTVTTASVTAFALWVYTDYRAWKAFGTGGTPPTPSGYWKMTKIRFNRLMSADSMRDASKLDTSGPTYLKGKLPDRTKERPRIVSRTMPQRQHPAPLPQDVKDKLHSIPRKIVAGHPDILELDLSATEGRSTDAIYALPDLPKRSKTASDRILKNEIAHVHPSENSLHVWLSEADAKAVVEAGWGERFPLSAMGWCHKGWTFVYAPRNMADVEILEKIVRAGVNFVTG